MPELDKLLELAKTAALESSQRLRSFGDVERGYYYSVDNSREIKALADRIMDDCILAALRPAGLPILSEESGLIECAGTSGLRFIVDPLDGTFNFVRGLGPCAVSIALWHEQRPIFGVIYDLWESQLVWGGATFGAFAAGGQLEVSLTATFAEAALCTGFPAHLEIGNDEIMMRFWKLVQPFSKVRMLGSAAMSLVNVAKGAADAYAENNIMVWDVAAGLAIVEGAGGRIRFRAGNVEHALNVYASNFHLGAAIEYDG